jgi:hypothetical protein
LKEENVDLPEEKLRKKFMESLYYYRRNPESKKKSEKKNEKYEIVDSLSVIVAIS